jgi:hypothetical protein
MPPSAADTPDGRSRLPIFASLSTARLPHITFYGGARGSVTRQLSEAPGGADQPSKTTGTMVSAVPEWPLTSRNPAPIRTTTGVATVADGRSWQSPETVETSIM